MQPYRSMRQADVVGRMGTWLTGKGRSRHEHRVRRTVWFSKCCALLFDGWLNRVISGILFRFGRYTIDHVHQID